MSDESEEIEANRQSDIADAYRICRNFQDCGAKAVIRKLRQHFRHKDGEEILELIVEVEKITSQSSKPMGC